MSRHIAELTYNLGEKWALRSGKRVVTDVSPRVRITLTDDTPGVVPEDELRGILPAPWQLVQSEPVTNEGPHRTYRLTFAANGVALLEAGDPGAAKLNAGVLEAIGLDVNAVPVLADPVNPALAEQPQTEAADTAPSNVGVDPAAPGGDESVETPTADPTDPTTPGSVPPAVE